jgi:hypothetical protein
MNNFKHYKGHGIKLSSFELIIDNERYPLEQIVSFELIETNKLPTLGILFILIGALLLLDEGDQFVMGGILFFSGLLLRIIFDSSYTLRLTTSNGNITALQSTLRREILDVITALDQAMAENRKRVESFGNILESPYIDVRRE